MVQSLIHLSLVSCSEVMWKEPASCCWTEHSINAKILWLMVHLLVCCPVALSIVDGGMLNVSHNCRIAFLLSAGLAFASQTLVLCSLACIHSGCGGQALYHSLCLWYFAFIAANFLLVIWPFWELSFGYLLNFAVYLSVQLWLWLL